MSGEMLGDDDALYPSSLIKRSRRTKAEMDVIRDAILRIVNSGDEMTVRHLFYRLVSAGVVEKTEAEHDNTVAHFASEAAAVALRHDLQARADRVAFLVPLAPPPAPRPKPPPGQQERKRDRKQERARRIQRMALGVVATLAMITPSVAQHSSLYLCLQQAPATFSVDQMLDTCRAEIRDWLDTCTRQRDISVCAAAVTEEADMSQHYKGARQ